ncbi:ZNF845 [Branchiostoma lanceolatum]|uniref:ZNF845 protein n=1 Tax=Branchiostoma lanceolatum TaxID=7740 RepID=A0A8J9VL85_BRALA|nr:ZNF845 [Branchiostoma lanceolatum]
MEERNETHWSNVEYQSLNSHCEDSNEYIGPNSNQFCDIMAHLMAATTGPLGPGEQTTQVITETANHSLTGSQATGGNITTEQSGSTDHITCAETQPAEQPDHVGIVQGKFTDRVSSDGEEVYQTESPDSESHELSTLTASQISQQPGPSKQGERDEDSDTDLAKYSIPYGGSRLYICDLCSLMFIIESDLACHMKTHPDKRPVVKQPYKRRPCKLKYARIDEHPKSQAGEKQFICTECGYSTNHRFKLTAHTKTHAVQKPYKCDLCNYSSVKEKTMDRHMLQHSQKGPFRCRVCSFTAADKADMEKHMSTHTELSGKPYKCFLCPYSAVKKKTLEKHHRMKHAQEKPTVAEAPEATILGNSSGEETPEVAEDTGSDEEETKNPAEQTLKPESCENVKFIATSTTPDTEILEETVVTNSQESPSESKDSLPTMSDTSSEDGFGDGDSDEDYIPDKSELNAAEQGHLDEDAVQDIPDETLECEECDFVTDSKKKLEAHSRKHVTNRKKKGKAQSRKSKTAGRKSYNCKECDYSTVHKSDLRQHMFRHNGKYPYTCKVCGYKTGKRNAMVKHSRTHTGEKPFKCDLCDFSTTQSNSLKEHKMRHSGEKPHMCDVCGLRFYTKANLNAHMRKHSDKETETRSKSHKCDKCEYATAYKTHLALHVSRYHTGEKPHMCEYCGYRTVDRSNLATHKKIHTGDRPFKCDLCDYESTQKKKLQQHMSKHTGEKPYMCTQCDFRTVYKPSLLTHMQTHTGEKPYKCDYCDYRTARKNSLKSHMIQHTGEKPHVCPDCGHRTAHRCNLLSHMRKVHKKDKPVVQPELPNMMALLFPSESGAEKL